MKNNTGNSSAILLFSCLAGCLLAAVHAGGAGATQAPLPYRIVSFNHCPVDMELVKVAKEAGYNGVQIQTEDGTVKPLQAFAEYDRRAHLIENCHKLGMEVSVWIHELNDIPAEFLLQRDTNHLQPGEVVCKYHFAGNQSIVINMDDPKLWALLDKRYDYFLHDLIPDVDALVLTVTETQVHATNPALFNRLVRFLNEKCRQYGKKLHVRTFVWHPDDLDNLMSAVRALPQDVVVMSKCVPQDWHLRSIDAPELGQVGQHAQIEEWDVEGEYFGLNKLVNCMPALLQRQLAHGLSKGIRGVCVRADRGHQSVLHQPSEVNLWALGLLASGRAATADDVWKTWAVQRYGRQAGPAVIPALLHSTDVVQEALYIEPFYFFDPRLPLGLAGEKDPFQHFANPHYWSQEYMPLHDRLVMGDPAEIILVESHKRAALEWQIMPWPPWKKLARSCSPPTTLNCGTLCWTTRFNWHGARPCTSLASATVSCRTHAIQQSAGSWPLPSARTLPPCARP